MNTIKGHQHKNNNEMNKNMYHNNTNHVVGYRRSKHVLSKNISFPLDSRFSSDNDGNMLYCEFAILAAFRLNIFITVRSSVL
jgi:hypothetical protein